MINTMLELSRSALSYKLDIVELIPVAEQLPKDWEVWGTDFEYHGPAELLQNMGHREVFQAEGQEYWEVFKSTDCDYVVRAGKEKVRVRFSNILIYISFFDK